MDLDAALPEATWLRAQAIDCGAFKVAVPFDWARNVVEDFDIIPAPSAPPWLVGAANVDGRIVPVVDLAAWLDTGGAQAPQRRCRLLVGGHGEDSYALLFDGLPMLARYSAGGACAGAPGLLAAHVLGEAVIAGAAGGASRPVIDARSLGDAWAAELAV